VGGLELPELPVRGVTQRGARLYILQGETTFLYYPPIPLLDGATNDPAVPTSKLLLTVVNAENLPTLKIEGQIEASADSIGFGANLQAVWPTPNALVFVGGGFNYFYRCLACAVPMGGAVDAM